MPIFLGDPVSDETAQDVLGILLVNLGTPDAPTTRAVRRYLSQFLSDPRVIELPRLIWWLVLNGVILQIRPRQSAKAYRKIWTDAGSPLLVISERQRAALEAQLRRGLGETVNVALGMTYGNPSIATALEALRRRRTRRLLVLPLYPQYSGSSTGSVFDAVTRALQRWRWVPDLRIISDYHDARGYIDELAASVKDFWKQKKGPRGHLLLSFHGIPRRYVENGDPYLSHCRATARLLGDALALREDEWTMSFQSRVGREEWLRPYTDETLAQWAESKNGPKNVDVVCPGFAADCLETLEEIAMQNRELFMDAGGESFEYVPALNDRPGHIEFLAELVERHCRGWLEAEETRNNFKARNHA